MEIRTLIKGPCSVAIKSIKQGTEQVAEDRWPWTAGHQVEREQGQHHTGITCRDRRHRGVATRLLPTEDESHKFGFIFGLKKTNLSDGDTEQ